MRKTFAVTDASTGETVFIAPDNDDAAELMQLLVEDQRLGPDSTAI